MAMGIPRGAAVANLYNLLPRVLYSSSFTTLHTARTTAISWSSILPSASITIPAITLNIPDAISDIWEGILRAVPKKKTSHMKKRHRQLAGKALKDVKSLVQCPACGKPKKAHMLCPFCVAEIGSRHLGREGREVEKRKAKANHGGVKQEQALTEESRLEKQDINATNEETRDHVEMEETDGNKLPAELFKEQAGPAAQGSSPIQEARIPARKRGGWRDELKYL